MPNKKKYNNKDKARKFRGMRPAVGENYMYDFSQPSNTQSTHLATTYEADGKYYVTPSITNNRAPYASNVYHPQSFRQAMDAGEGIPFNTQAEASKFAEGSWKLPKYPRPQFQHGGETDIVGPGVPQWKEGDAPIDLGMMDEITLTDFNPRFGVSSNPNSPYYLDTSPSTGVAPDPSGMSIRQLLKLAKSVPKMMKYAQNNYKNLGNIGDKVQTAYLKAKQTVDLGLYGIGKEKGAIKKVKELESLMGKIDKAGDIIGPNRYKLMPNTKSLSKGLDPDDPITMMKDVSGEVRDIQRKIKDFTRLGNNTAVPKADREHLLRLADKQSKGLGVAEKELDDFLTGKFKAFEDIDMTLQRSFTPPTTKGVGEFLPSNRNLELNPLAQPRFQSSDPDLNRLGKIDNILQGERLTPGESIMLDQYKNPFKMNKYGGQVSKFEHGGETDLPANKTSNSIENIDNWYKSYLQGPNYERMSGNYEQTVYPEKSRNSTYLSNDTDYPRHIFPNKEAGLSFSKDQVYMGDSKIGSNYTQYPGNFSNPKHDWKKSFFGYGKYGKGDRSINMSTSNVDEEGSPWNFEEVLAHEYGHVDFDRTTGDESVDTRILNAFNPIGRSESQANHDKRLGEVRADVMALRYLMQKEGVYDSVKGGEFTKDILDKFIKTQESKPRPTNDTDIPWSGRLRKNYNDKDIIWMMNNLAQNEVQGSNVNAKYGGKVTKFQHGGEHDPHVGNPHDIEPGKSQRELTDFKGWYGDYMLSDKYKERLTSSGDYGSEEEMDTLIKQRYDALQDIDMTVTGTASFMRNNKMTLADVKDSPGEVATTIAHEAGHTIGGSYDQYSFKIRDRKKRKYKDQKAISPNDIRDLEDRNVLYRNAPYMSIDEENAYPVKTGEAGNEGFVKSLDRGNRLINIGSIRRGTPSIEGGEDIRIQMSDYDSTEDYVRARYTLPEGYGNKEKEAEIARLVAQVEDLEAAKYSHIVASTAYNQAKANASNSADRSNLSEEDAIAIQTELQTAKKNYLDSESNVWFRPRIAVKPYTAEGGDELVFKRGKKHAVGGAESYADVVGMRRYLYSNYGLNPKDDITPEQYQEIMNDKDAPKYIIPDRFKKKYTSPEDATYILNNIAMKSPQAGELVQSKYGGKVMKKIKKYPDGGKTTPPVKPIGQMMNPNIFPQGTDKGYSPYTHVDYSTGDRSEVPGRNWETIKEFAVGSPPPGGWSTGNVIKNIGNQFLEGTPISYRMPLSTVGTPNEEGLYRDGGQHDPPKKKPSYLQYREDFPLTGWQEPYYGLDRTQTAITEDSTSLANAWVPSFMDEEIRNLQINREYRDKMKSYSKEDIRRLNYNLPPEPKVSSFDTFLQDYNSKEIPEEKVPKYPNGGAPQYGEGGDFLAGIAGGLLGSVPLAGGFLEKGVNSIATDMGADMDSQAAGFGSMAGGIGSMFINPAGAAGNLGKLGKFANIAQGLVAEDGGQFSADLEAEDGEVVVGNATVNPNYNGGYAKQHGDLPIFTLGGKTHEQGGIGMNVQGEEPAYIFSNNKDLKVPKMYAKGGTYADAANKIGKDLEKISIMESGGIYDKNTAKRMKPAVMAKFGGLYDAQEKFKVENGFSNPDMGYAHNGGMGVGHPHNNDLGMWDLDTPDFSEYETNYGEQFGGINTTGNNPPPEESKLPWQLYAANAIPGAMNMAKGLFGEAPTLELDRMEKQEYRDFNPLMDTYLGGQDRNLASLRAGLQGSGATGAQLRGGFQAGASNAQAQTGQFFGGLSNQMEQSRRETDRYNQGIAQQNQQMGLMEDQFALQNDPINSIITGGEQLVSAGTNLYMDNLKTQNMGTQMYDWRGKFIGNQ